MSRVFVSGAGAVSPAGWGLGLFRAALSAGVPLPIEPLARPGWDRPLRARLVPAPNPRPAFLAHPRLRRAGQITHYAAAAALEAVAALRPSGAARAPLGLIVCLHTGCVQYSCRFLEEALVDPATASPILFPETVFAAPGGHIAALLGEVPRVHTLIGDGATFLQGVALAADWLAAGHVPDCLVVGAEETNWLLADGLWHLEHEAVISGGAGALCLSGSADRSLGVELAGITDLHTYGARCPRAAAIQAMRAELPPGPPGELLCDGLSGSPGHDRPEAAAWEGWSGPRLSPKRVLGEGLMAGAAWQCVAAVDWLARAPGGGAVVSLAGSNQHAGAARFIAAPGCAGGDTGLPEATHG